MSDNKPSATITQPTRTVSLATREKISLSKTKFKISDLIEASLVYINSILNQEPTEKKIATVSGLCLAIGISRSRLYELAKESTEVADTLEYIQLMQEEQAVQGGMTNRLNPIFSMFLLKSKHEYKDTPQQLTQNNTFNVSADLLADALAIIRSKKKPSKEADQQ